MFNTKEGLLSPRHPYPVVPQIRDICAVSFYSYMSQKKKNGKLVSFLFF